MSFNKKAPQSKSRVASIYITLNTQIDTSSFAFYIWAENTDIDL